MAASGVATRPRDTLGPDDGPATGLRVIVVSACSKRKLAGDSAGTGPRGLLTARDRYAGRAHVRVRAAVDRWHLETRDVRIEWSIVSAGLGLLDEATCVSSVTGPAQSGVRGAVTHFHHLLERHQLGTALFATINAHLAARSLLVREGTIVERPCRPAAREGSRTTTTGQVTAGVTFRRR